jgi:hypothetical protein
MKLKKPLTLRKKYPMVHFNLTMYIVSYFKENPNGCLDEIAKRLNITNSLAFSLYHRAKKNKLL